MAKVLGPERGSLGLGCKAELRASPAALACLSSPCLPGVLIRSVPSMGCAKQADNPLIHKPTHCHAIGWAVDGGGEEISSLIAISVCLCSFSLYVCFSSLLDFTYFPHNSVSEFIFFSFLSPTPWVLTFRLSYSLSPSHIQSTSIHNASL